MGAPLRFISMKRSRSFRTPAAASRTLKRQKLVASSSARSRASLAKFRPTYASGGFPARSKATLRFALERDLDASGGSATATFKANGPQQPLDSGATHQPLGFDEWAASYRHYVVTAARCKVTAVHDDTNNNVPVMMTIIASGSSTYSAPTTEKMLEYGDRSECKEIGSYIGSGSRDRQVSLAIDMAKAFGVKDIVDEEDFGALTTAVPANQYFFHVILTQINANTPAISNPVIVEIEYDIVWGDPNILAQS